MKRVLFFTLAFFCLGLAWSQNAGLGVDLYKPDHEKELKFLPYIAIRHGGMEAIATWKSNNTVQYYKELWYFCESFYVRRNVQTEGVTMDEGAIDISRFESFRKANEESVVVMPGFKDVLVLLPGKDLIYLPQ